MNCVSFNIFFELMNFYFNLILYVCVYVISDPPNFRLRRWPGWGIPLKEGTPVSILCIVDANPTSLPFWIKGLFTKDKKTKCLQINY